MKIPVPNNQENTLLVGFPSNGLVGTFSISYLIHHLKMRQIGEIEIPDLPSTLFVEGGEILTQIRAYNKNNIFVINTDVPFTQNFENDIALGLDKLCNANKVKKIIIERVTLEIGQIEEALRIHGA